jgi:hypothetical protein
MYSTTSGLKLGTFSKNTTRLMLGTTSQYLYLLLVVSFDNLVKVVSDIFLYSKELFSFYHYCVREDTFRVCKYPYSVFFSS